MIPGPGICLTPSQVDILVSDDSHAFCPTQLCIDVASDVGVNLCNVKSC